MERLTERNFNFTTNFVKRDIDAWSIAQALNKLQEYENAEEDNLLLRLPCKVGTEVYEIAQQFWIDRKGCKDCVYFGNDGLGDYCDYCEDEPAACTKIVPREFTMRMLEDFGKTVFLTKAEAEQALEKLKDN